MEASMNVSSMRVEYKQGTLDPDSVERDPFAQFKAWFQDAMDSKLFREVNAMTVSTVSKDGFPSSRIVLLKVSFTSTNVLSKLTIFPNSEPGVRRKRICVLYELQ